MHLVADAVAWAAVGDAEVFGSALDEEMVVKIFRAALQHVVVDVGHGKLRPDSRYAHGFKFQIGHGACCVLGKGLVNPQGDLAARSHIAADQMFFDDLLCYCESHSICFLSLY